MCLSLINLLLGFISCFNLGSVTYFVSEMENVIKAERTSFFPFNDSPWPYKTFLLVMLIIIQHRSGTRLKKNKMKTHKP